MFAHEAHHRGQILMLAHRRLPHPAQNSRRVALGEAVETSRPDHAPAVTANQYAEVICISGANVESKLAPFLQEAQKKCGTPRGSNHDESRRRCRAVGHGECSTEILLRWGYPNHRTFSGYCWVIGGTMLFKRRYTTSWP